LPKTLISDPQCLHLIASVSISSEQHGHFLLGASLFIGVDVLFFVSGVIAKAKATDRAITFSTINKSISIPSHTAKYLAYLGL